ncbi:MAG: LysM peptidoglycan-binding domain-containing protein [Bdellovibrionales bacterium]|nr:LysM peptidoglycan-binding domain-containing protein [Bdellovibrionales bacterium]
MNKPFSPTTLDIFINSSSPISRALSRLLFACFFSCGVVFAQSSQDGASSDGGLHAYSARSGSEDVRERIAVPSKRNPAFRVPAKMRPRVQFWIDVFSKYGKHHAVIHHRMYPHIIFDILDFYGKAESYSEVKLEHHRKAEIKKKTAEIESALKWLASGKSPRNPFEQHIVTQMSSLPGGTKKYQDVYKNDWIRSQRGIRERYREAVERSGRYIHILERVFVLEYGLPIELTRLPFVESSFDYKAYSSVGAAGIWQFMPATGRLYDLKVTRVVDERRDVTAATKAAARYLTDAYQRLGTWPLALTSYNHGVYGVLKKVNQLGTKDIAQVIERVHDQPFGFASQNFYPEFLAALEIYDDPEHYFPGVRKEPPQEIARRKLTRSVTAGEVSRSLGVPVDHLKNVNYALHSHVWSGRYPIPSGYTLNVPLQYRTELASMKLPKASAASVVSATSGDTYRVRHGDSLGKIASKHGISVASLKSMNGLRSDLVRVGQTLVVSHGSSSSSTLRPTTSRAAMDSSVSVGSHQYQVRSGDTLFSIARAHRTTVESLKRANALSSSSIRVGQVLKLPSGAQGGQGEEAVYSVRKGDSLWVISNRFGVSQDAIKRRNGLTSSSLRIGQKLNIPR